MASSWLLHVIAASIGLLQQLTAQVPTALIGPICLPRKISKLFAKNNLHNVLGIFFGFFGMLTFWISRFHNSYFSLILRMPTFCISRFHTSWTSKTHNNRAGGRFAGSPKCPKSIQNLQCWSNVGPFLVSFRYTMGLELTFHNFHIHIRALDTRGILLKNMVYHDNNKHIFFGPAHPSPL